MTTGYEARLLRNRISVGDSYLTQREYQCVAAYMDGTRQGDMPSMLACARKTIDSHVREAKERLGARTIHELIAIVARADALRGRGRSSTHAAVTGMTGVELPRRRAL